MLRPLMLHVALRLRIPPSGISLPREPPVHATFLRLLLAHAARNVLPAFRLRSTTAADGVTHVGRKHRPRVATVAEHTGDCMLDTVAVARLPPAFACPSGRARAHAGPHAGSVVAASDELRPEELPHRRSAADADERARVVVREERAMPTPVQTAEPDHREHVVAVRVHIGNRHRVAVGGAVHVAPARLAESASVLPLREASPLERESLMPVRIMHARDGDKRASVEAAFVVVPVPLDAHPLSALPGLRRVFRRRACARGARFPDRRARPAARRHVAVDRVVRRGVLQVVVRRRGADERQQRKQTEHGGLHGAGEGRWCVDGGRCRRRQWVAYMRGACRRRSRRSQEVSIWLWLPERIAFDTACIGGDEGGRRPDLAGESAARTGEHNLLTDCSRRANLRAATLLDER